MAWRLTQIVWLCCLGACFAKAPTERYECSAEHGLSCPENYICRDFKCYRSCGLDAECGLGEACIDTICQDVQACVSSVECPENFYCLEKKCLPRLELGQACEGEDFACLSGHCIDNLCCDSACDESCMSCKSTQTALNDGSCAAILNGLDPNDDCTGPTACDGAGACFNKPQGTDCEQGHECLSGYCQQGYCCDGACDGVCNSCDGLFTDGADGVCLGIVAGSDPYNACEIYSCDGEGACYAGLMGDGCSDETECLSGYCVDGVCCQESCTELCSSCSESLNGIGSGLCLATADGLDPNNDCLGVAACDGEGTCWAKEDGESCLENYQCDSGFCVDGVCCESVCDGLCSGCIQAHTGQADGTCAFVISGLDPNENCSDNLACDGSGACWDRAVGENCSEAYECVSGFCVDGVCCESACDGACSACATGGTCTAYEAHSDPEDECAGVRTCDGAGACFAKQGLVACGGADECISQECCGGVCAANFADVALPIDIDLHGLGLVQENEVLIAGEAGNVWRGNTSAWTLNQPSSNDLLVVAGGQAGNLFVGGTDGTFLRLQDNTWHNESLPQGSAQVRSILESADGTVYVTTGDFSVVNDQRVTTGKILQRVVDGSGQVSWNEIQSGMMGSVIFTDLTMVLGNLWALGYQRVAHVNDPDNYTVENGFLWRYLNGEWQQETLATCCPQDWTEFNDKLWIAAPQNEVTHLYIENDTAWQDVSDTSVKIKKLLSDGTSLWGIGDAGHLARYDGTQWCTQTIAEENLNDIFKGGSSLYVVGDGNTFLKFDY